MDTKYTIINGELYHYGVPGMKWGVRKDRSASSSGRGLFGWKRKNNPNDPRINVKKKKLSELSDAEIKARIARLDLEKKYIDAVNNKRPTKVSKKSDPKKIKLSEVSDDELRSKITRLELEKRYKELAKDVGKQKTSRGKDFVLRVMEKIGENVLTDIGTQAGATVLGEGINKAARVSSSDTSKRIVNPRKNQTNKK